MKKLMKKAVSMCTAVSAAFAAGSICRAEFSDIDEFAPYFNAAHRLEEFNIMSGYEDGTFRPEAPVTRAEAAALMCRAVNGSPDDVDASAAQELFSDVAADHWALKYIQYVFSMGIISGDGDGCFRPEDYVTYAELDKMLIGITGYSAYAEQFGSYPENVVKCAQSIGITEGITASYDDLALRGDAALMLSRALEVPIVVIDGYGMDADGKFVPSFKILDGEGAENQTLLTYLHGIYKATGTVGSSSGGAGGSSVSGQIYAAEESYEAVSADKFKGLRKGMSFGEVRKLIPSEYCVSQLSGEIISTSKYYIGDGRYIDLIYLRKNDDFLLDRAVMSSGDGNVIEEYGGNGSAELNINY